MVDYNPNVPANGAENISISQPKILNNFQQLNTIFAEDHHTWDDATASKRGKHTKITFPTPLVADPATSTLTCSLYSKEDPFDTPNARPQLYCQNINGVNNVRQITNRFVKAQTNNGYWMLPNGTLDHPSVILMWGTLTVLADGDYTITFPTITNYLYPGPHTTGFPRNLFNFQLTATQSTTADSPFAYIDSGSFPGTPNGPVRMHIKATGGGWTLGSINWFAIGN